MVLDDRQIDGFARLIHQLAHARAGEVDDVAGLQEAAAGDESLDADIPAPGAAVEADVAFLLKGRQQAVGGGGRQFGGSRQFRQRHRAVGFAQDAHDVEGTDQRLDRLGTGIGDFRVGLLGIGLRFGLI